MIGRCDKCHRTGNGRFWCMRDDCEWSGVQKLEDDPVKDIKLPTVDIPNLPKIKINKRLKPLKVVRQTISNPIVVAIASRTTVGRIAYTIVGVASTVALTQNNIIMFEDLSLLQIAITIGGMGLLWAIQYFVKNSVLASKLDQLVDVLSDELVKATSDASDGGKIVTKGEAQSIVKSVLNAIFSK